MRNPTPRQSRYSLPSIGGKVMQVAGDIYRRRGFAQAHIISHWPAIVGDMLAEYSAPEKLSFPRAVGDDTPASAEGGLLTVRVDGPAALELKHLEPQILERINGFYGYRAVVRLKLMQAPLSRKPRRNRRQFAPLSENQKAALAQSLDSIEEPALKQSLAKLGERVLSSRRR